VSFRPCCRFAPQNENPARTNIDRKRSAVNFERHRLPRHQPFRGDDFLVVDTTKLPPITAMLDSADGHISVTATPEQIQQAIVSQGAVKPTPTQLPRAQNFGNQ
jgi:hypothetical protein